MRGYLEHGARMNEYRSFCEKCGGSSKISDALYDKEGYIIGAFVRVYQPDGAIMIVDVGTFYYEGKSEGDVCMKGFV